ncbi:MAG: LysM peptidoglycan-binding domain-containing protein [Lachnospiraceae bacterium]|nr:LysM peptidoglycan-binding domain-containing protein [Lachnospiraceae bacterium]
MTWFYRKSLILGVCTKNYNMLVNGKADHSLKSGKFVLTIPAEYQKAGRKFALLGLDRTGKVLCFTDTDLSDSTLTTTLLIDGYAFMLVYSDGGVSAVKTTSVTAGNKVQSSGTYKVKKGDTLSGIAKKSDTTVAKLMRNNNIKEKDKIREGQILKY